MKLALWNIIRTLERKGHKIEASYLKKVFSGLFVMEEKDLRDLEALTRRIPSSPEEADSLRRQEEEIIARLRPVTPEELEEIMQEYPIPGEERVSV